MTDPEVSEHTDDPHNARLFLVANVVGDRVPLQMQAGITIGEGLAALKEHGLSHAPVVMRQTVLGIFSLDSISQCFNHHPVGSDPRTAEIDDYLLPAEYARPTQPLSSAQDLIVRQGIALVGDEHHLLGIVTADDVRSYLWNIAQPFSLIHDIEMSIRQLVFKSCPTSERLDGALEAARFRHLRGKSVDALTMGQLVRVVTEGANAELFSAAFGKNFSLAASKMRSIVALRNRVFHFSGEVSEEDLASLADAKSWLDRRLQLLELRKRGAS